MAKKHSGGGSRKIGRNKIKCELYRTRHTRERNKVRKIFKHIKRHPNNLQAKKRLEQLKELL